MKEIEIYKTPDGKMEVEVHFEGETVWLNRQQLSVLFDRDVKTIGKHINNLFKDKELGKNSVVANFAITANDGKTYQVDHYNLDVIISVGYRVKSKQGTQFRQWATQRLKDYLVKGYALNEKRLKQLSQNMQQLQQTIQLISAGSTSETLQLGEAKGLLHIINSYTRSFELLSQYDSNSLSKEQLNQNITYEIQYGEARAAIDQLKQQLKKKGEATNLFGNEKDEGFKSSLKSIVQTYDGEYLYPSIEEQAANLLYFIIKNHSFSDGNKRIGAFLFIWFLDKNSHRFKKGGELKINDNALTAIALLIAQSQPEEKELMIDLIVNLVKN